MEKFYLGQIKDDKNITPIYVGRENDGSISFFDENDNCIAVQKPPYPLMVTNEYRDRPPEFLSQVNSLWRNILENDQSLKQHDDILKEIAKTLEIDEKAVRSTSSASLNQSVKEKDDDKKLKLDDDKDTDKSQTNEHNKEVLETLGIRQETKLSTRVNDRYTLGELLGVDDPDATLICVDSGSVSERDTNSLHSLLIKHSDGSLERADMLSQVDGISPDREVNALNRDGTSLEQVKERSMFRFKTPDGKEAMVSVSYGPTGTLAMQYGEVDITNNNQFMAVPLETESTRFVTKEVQETLDTERGIYNTSRRNNEVDYHRDHDCEDIGKEEADGNPETGHHHIDDAELDTVASNILNENPELDALYTTQGLAKELKAYIENHPDQPMDKSIQDFTDDAVQSCDHLPNRNR